MAKGFKTSCPQNLWTSETVSITRFLFALNLSHKRSGGCTVQPPSIPPAPGTVLVLPATERSGLTAAKQLDTAVTTATMDEASKSAWCRANSFYPQQERGKLNRSRPGDLQKGIGRMLVDSKPSSARTHPRAG